MKKYSTEQPSPLNSWHVQTPPLSRKKQIKSEIKKLESYTPHKMVLSLTELWKETCKVHMSLSRKLSAIAGMRKFSLNFAVRKNFMTERSYIHRWMDKFGFNCRCKDLLKVYKWDNYSHSTRLDLQSQQWMIRFMWKWEDFFFCQKKLWEFSKFSGTFSVDDAFPDNFSLSKTKNFKLNESRDFLSFRKVI